jgi:hypothetical protein
MRAKQGSTVSGMYRRSGSLTPPIPACAATTSLPDAIALYGAVPPRGELALRPGRRRSRSGPETAQDEGLLHDARNLMGAIGLYCDLLSMPGVLKPEHRRYPEELRLLGTRSGALIEHLIKSLFQGGADGLAEDASSKAADAGSSFWAGARIAGADAVGSRVSPAKPVSLRRPAAVSTNMMEIGNGLGEVSAPDCHSCSVPSPPDTVSNTPKVTGARGKLHSPGLPGAVESIANSRARSKHSEDSKADAGRLVSR